jgi:hypothetical protein
MTYKVDFGAIPWETPMTGVRCKVFRDGRRQLRLVEYGKDMPPHWCAKGHAGYLLEGTFEIRFASGVLVFNAGDGIFIPAGDEHKHSARVLSDLVRAVFVEDF